MQMMKRKPGDSSVVALLLALAVVSMPVTGLFSAETAVGTDGWVCAPCGCSQDHVVKDQPGLCPACRMKLIRQSDVQHVGILLFNGVQDLDYTAPWEVFRRAGFEVFTVSAGGAPITTALGLKVTPDHSFDNSPTPTILLVPGGRGERTASADPATIAWLKTNATIARQVVGVSTGALILAKTGLLDGVKATTLYYVLDDLRDLGKGTDVVTDARWVDSGKMITTAGGSSGLEAAIHLVSRISGTAAAQQVALDLEHDWKPDASYARASMAETHMPHLTGSEWQSAEMLNTTGDRDQWETRYRMPSSMTGDALLARVKTVLSSMREWSVGSGGPTGASGQWKFVDDTGAPWVGVARVEQHATESGVWLITLRVDRSR